MAILSRKGFEVLMQRIWETGGLTPDMEKDIRRLKDDFDEREGILKRYGESYEGEDEEYEYKERETKARTDESNDTTDWEAKYNEMKDRYVKRFFGNKETPDKDDTIIEEKSETETKTIEDILYGGE